MTNMPNLPFNKTSAHLATERVLQDTFNAMLTLQQRVIELEQENIFLRSVAPQQPQGEEVVPAQEEEKAGYDSVREVREVEVLPGMPD